MRADRVAVSSRLLAAIEAAREAHGVTQAELGEEIGKSVGYFSSLKTGGVQTMDRGELLRILDVLELDPVSFGVERERPGEVWTLPDDFNWVPQRDRLDAQKVLGWMFRIRSLSEGTPGES
jgi:transcriptional regulator with XRE-family HTH domain